MEKKLKAISIKIDADLHRRLQHLKADGHFKTVSNLIIELLDNYANEKEG